MIWALAYNPLREHMSFTSDPDAGGSGVNGTGDLSIIGPGEGSYANGVLEEHIHPHRRISAGGAEAYSVPGGQYIKVQREHDPSAADVPQSFELTVDVRGEAEDEAGEFITTSAEYTEADVQAAESQDSGGIGGILPWAIGGLGVIALAGGGIILAGRRGA